MRRIEHLPRAVHSSLRSSVILFDLTRVVEELIFNSLDADATKISVSVGVGTCYVRVEDNGCGITRDGLVLLGERYGDYFTHATSKLHCLAEMDASSGSFGFRGEALGSLSDISLLEIITKARGRPNEYRKVMKGCKCLCLGIDGRRQDVGTTVIVRDLFYNQPVRRKCMLSSPKKVLHSVKKCVLRVALVHPRVSFTVIDIESEEKLLCTHPSLSPLGLVMSGFGIEVSSCLHELNCSEGLLKLSGYLSGPRETFSTKVFQYVYINSRFVCKGPIHKLLNNLTASHKCSDLLKEPESQNGKRSRTQAYPAYILNLCCPCSSYDLTFEPSKTIVEFKDWVPVLSFIGQVIKDFWRQFPIQGESHIFGDEVSGENKMWKENGNIVSPAQDILANSEVEKKCRVPYHQTYPNLGPSSFSLKMPYKEANLLSHQKDHRMPSRNLYKNTAEVKGQLTKEEYVNQIDNSFQDMSPTWDTCVAKHIPIACPESDSHLWAPDNDLFPEEDNFLMDSLTATPTSKDGGKYCILGSRWENESVEVDVNMVEGSTGSLLTLDHFEYRNTLCSSDCPRGLRKPFLRSCSLLQNMPPYKAMPVNQQGFEVQFDHVRTKRKRIASDDMIDVVDTDDSDQSFDVFSKTSWQDKAATPCLSSSISTGYHTTTEVEVLPRDSMKPYPGNRKCFYEERDLPNDLLPRIEKIDSHHQSSDGEWYSTSPDPIFGTAPWKGGRFFEKYALEGNFRSCRSVGSSSFTDKVKDDYRIFGFDTMQDSLTEEDCRTLSCTDSVLDYDYCISPKRNVCEFPYHEPYSDDIIFKVGRSNKLIEEIDWLSLDTYGKDNTDPCATKAFHIPSPSYNNKGNRPCSSLGFRNLGQYHVLKGRSRRCRSAPPFCKAKSKFSPIYNCSTRRMEGELDTHIIHDVPSLPVTSESNLSQPIAVIQRNCRPSVTDGSVFYPRTCMEKMACGSLNMNSVRKSEGFEKSHCFQICNTDSIDDFIASEVEDLECSGIKWKKGNQQATDVDKSHNLDDQNSILDISSGLLHLASDSLVPESINKDCLEDAKVLLQLDKKFIPVIAGGIIAIIDQHAADERIRLEDLRQKVLSGEGKTVAYLDSKQELVLPEIGYQLLHNYAEQIQNWGWICNIHAHRSGSFTKNLNLLHNRPSVVTLLAVPCILGVNLSENDLLEFLDQLAETDGSSTMPPSVLRVLNFKACRGAIMFGDSLLPSECSLIVEELKQTSLCFQCAHGRPTTAPLVNLEALHKQIAQLGLWNGESSELWHGLCWHKPSLERATLRLGSATSV